MAKYKYDFVNTVVREEVIKRTQHQCYVPRPLTVNCLKNAKVMPYKNDERGEVITTEGMAVATDFPHKISEGKYSVNVQKKGRAIFLGSFFTWGWGHCFTDHFNKLWFFTTDEFRRLKEEKNIDVVFVAAEIKIPNYVYTLFEYAGFDLHQAKLITQPTQYEELYIPDNCYYQIDDGWYRYYTDEYIGLLNNMKLRAKEEATRNSNMKTYERIYFTRSQGTFGSAYKDLGEKTIEQLFEKNGYTIIAPEKHTVAEQIWMMMNVKDIVATDGSICHATTFCNPATKLTILMKADFLTMCQVTANQIADMTVSYVSAHHSIFVSNTAPWHGPFFMCITRNLELYLGHKIPHVPYYMQFPFLVYCIRELYMNTLRKSSFADSLTRKLLGIKK